MADKKSENAKAAAKRLLKSLMFSKGSQSTSAPVRVKSKNPQKRNKRNFVVFVFLVGCGGGFFFSLLRGSPKEKKKKNLWGFFWVCTLSLVFL